MLALLTSLVCSQECDRAPIVEMDDMPTQPYKYPAQRVCPKCNSADDVDEFDPGETEHCWKCGCMWRI